MQYYLEQEGLWESKTEMCKCVVNVAKSEEEKVFFVRTRAKKNILGLPVLVKSQC